jgi:hypothetical protein
MVHSRRHVPSIAIIWARLSCSKLMRGQARFSA